MFLLWEYRRYLNVFTIVSRVRKEAKYTLMLGFLFVTDQRVVDTELDRLPQPFTFRTDPPPHDRTGPRHSRVNHMTGSAAPGTDLDRRLISRQI